jgi:outer membrane translocation and assembly module TamA
MQVSLGGGLRYDSLIGPVRVDVARRSGDDAVFARYPRWAVHFGLSEAF